MGLHKGIPLVYYILVMLIDLLKHFSIHTDIFLEYRPLYNFFLYSLYFEAHYLQDVMIIGSHPAGVWDVLLHTNPLWCR